MTTTTTGVRDLYYATLEVDGDVARSVRFFASLFGWEAREPHVEGGHTYVNIATTVAMGINDDAEDPSHLGYEGMRSWVDKYNPRHILHGHVHPTPGQVIERYGDTQVHYVSGAKVIRL